MNQSLYTKKKTNLKYAIVIKYLKYFILYRYLSILHNLINLQTS